MNSDWKLAGRRGNLQSRAAIMQTIRHYFNKEGFLEVETPLRIPAPAPESHIDAIPSGTWFLQTSPELCMKRMLAAGYGQIYQICSCWRDAERGNRHLPEFRMLEWYRAYSDYTVLMHDCENLIRDIASSLGSPHSLSWMGAEISLNGPWERLTVREAYLRYAGTTPDEALETDRFDTLMVEAIEPNLGCTVPTFLSDYPAERAALSRLKADDPTIAERFELYIGGIELANGFSELTDAAEQLRRFTLEEEFRRGQGKQPYPLPDRFIDALYDMPPSAGIALGIDRLVMLMLDVDSIDEVIAFTPEEL
jgi:lysyl-tRNA synthetase class 2